MSEPGPWLVSLDLCKQTTKWLAQPPSYDKVPVQQLCVFFDTTAIFPPQYWKAPTNGLQTPQIWVQARKCLQVHGKDEVYARESKVHYPEISG